MEAEQQATGGHIKLSDSLASLLGGDAPLSIRLIGERVGDRGFGLLLVVLSLPSALPVPAAGYSVPFGILLALLAWQMIRGLRRPVFPQRFEKAQLSPAMAQRLLRGSRWFFQRIEWCIRPRLAFMTQRGGRVLMGALVAAMAVLMMIPIPLTNTAPAFVIFLIGVGLTEEDGLFALGACVAGVLAVCFYAALVWAILVYGPEIVVTLKDAIKAWLGMGPG